MAAPNYNEPSKMGFPPAGGYPTGAQPAYPAQPGYPPAQPAYPGAMSYPVQPAYPPTQPAYAPAQPGYPPVQPGLPTAPPGYSEAPPNYQGGPAGQPGMPVYGFAPKPAMDPSMYNASGGGSAYQAGTVGEGEPKFEDTPDVSGLGGSFGDKAIRHAFVRKVYLILMLQLGVTVSFIALFTFHQGVKDFVRNNLWVYILSYVVFLVTYITLVCCSSIRRKWPGNIIMLSVFTLAMSYMTGTISSMYDTQIVLMTIGITAVICFLISLFAMQTKFDFTGCGTYLFVAGMVMLIFGIVAMFTYNNIMNTVYSAGIALLFSMYLVYDTQMLLGGRKYQLSAEEHIFGALTLYLDIIQIFIALLGLSRN